MNFIESAKNLKKIEPYIAIAILTMLIILGILLYKNNILKEEIAKTCGYEIGEDYSCYCEKGFIIQKKLELENLNNLKPLEIPNDSLDR